MLDGELWSGNFPDTVSCLNRGSAPPSSPPLRYYAFDLVPVDEYEAGRFTTPQADRKAALDLLAQNLDVASDLVSVLPWTPVKDDAHLATVYDLLISQGFEGAMLKAADAPYATRRTHNWLKMKPLQTDEFPIIGFREGRDSLRGSLGAILFRLPDGREGAVGTGFSDSDRARIWVAREAILRRKLWVQVAHQDRDLGGALSFPRSWGSGPGKEGGEVDIP